MAKRNSISTVERRAMNPCVEYFQDLVDYLSGNPEEDRYLSARIAGNRQEANPFVLYIKAEPIRYTPPLIEERRLLSPGSLSGPGEEYFSDRVAVHGEDDVVEPLDAPQPFDAERVDIIDIYFFTPNGPLSFIDQGGNLVAQFSTIQCTDSGLVVCTSDFDRSIVLLSFRKETGVIVHPV
jgi:hypothetical protein